MIIVRFTGGLGNQMFIYAMMIVLKRKFNKEIYADLSRYIITNEHDGFDIIKYFDVEIEQANIDIMKRIAPLNYILPRRVLKTLGIGRVEYYNECIEKKVNNVSIISDFQSTNYNENSFSLILGDSELVHYKGNWINPKYWNDDYEFIAKQFKFRKELLSPNDIELIEKFESENSVGIHIRGGDYTGNSTFDLCGESYYKDAISHLSKINNEKFKYYVFSENNVDWKLDIDYEMISHPLEAGIDLYLMSRCKYLIIANSTFSLWAGLLKKQEKNNVIAPLYMYRQKGYLIKMPVPQDWYQIDNIEHEHFKAF